MYGRNNRFGAVPLSLCTCHASGECGGVSGRMLLTSLPLAVNTLQRCASLVRSNLTLKIEESIVEQVRCYKFLRVVVNDTLTWVDHIDMVCKKVSRSLNLLHRLSWFLPQPLLLLFLKSYILPHVMLCGLAVPNLSPVALSLC